MNSLRFWGKKRPREQSEAKNRNVQQQQVEEATGNISKNEKALQAKTAVIELEENQKLVNAQQIKIVGLEENQQNLHKLVAALSEKAAKCVERERIEQLEELENNSKKMKGELSAMMEKYQKEQQQKMEQHQKVQQKMEEYQKQQQLNIDALTEAQKGNVEHFSLLREKIDELERKQKADQVEHRARIDEMAEAKVTAELENQKLVKEHKALRAKMEEYHKEQQQKMEQYQKEQQKMEEYTKEQQQKMEQYQKEQQKMEQYQKEQQKMEEYTKEQQQKMKEYQKEQQQKMEQYQKEQQKMEEYTKEQQQKMEQYQKEQQKMEEYHKEQQQTINELQETVAVINGIVIVLTHQNRWDSAVCHEKLTLIGPDQLIVQHTGGSQSIRSVFPERPIPKGNFGIFYYEVKIFGQGYGFFIGLATKKMPLGGYVGENDGTYAYDSWGRLRGHAVDGCRQDRKSGRPYIDGMPTFRCGTVVGCGVDLATRQIIYTLNGQRLNTANLFVAVAAELFPCVTLCNAGDKIEANFGPDFEYKF